MRLLAQAQDISAPGPDNDNCEAPPPLTEIYPQVDASVINWAWQTPVVPCAPARVPACVAGGKLHVICGNCAAHTGHPTDQIFDLTTKTWSVGLSHPDVASGASGVFNSDAVAVSNTMIISGPGHVLYLGSTYYEDYCTRLNLAAGTWTFSASSPALNVYLTYETMVASGGNAYLLGGVNGYDLTTVGSVYRYNVAADNYTSLTSMPAVRRNVAAAVIGDTIYVMGGGVNPATPYTGSNNFWKYSFTGNNWITATVLPFTIMWGQAVSYNDPTDGWVIYVFGGYNASGAMTNQCYAWTRNTGTWTAMNSLLEVQRSFGAGRNVWGGAVSGDTIWMAGGYNGAITGNMEKGGIVLPVTTPDVQTVAILAPTPGGTVNRGTSWTPSATVRNNGSVSANVPVRFYIGDVPYSQVVTQAVGAGATVTFNFPVWNAPTANPAGSPWAMWCQTELVGDPTPGNDRVTSSITVQSLDAAATAISAPTGTINQGTSVTPSATVQNNGNTAQTITARFKIGPPASPVYNQTAATASPVAPGGTGTITFAAWNTSTYAGTYATQCSTELGADMLLTNDKFTGAGCFIQVLDAEARTVDAPPDSVNQDAANVTPSATIRNNGNTSQTFNVQCAINDGVYATNTTSVTLGAGLSGPANFAAWSHTVAGPFTVTVTTQLSGDMVPGNNTATKATFVRRFDALTTILNAPGDTVDSTLNFTVQATVRNNGNTIQNIQAKYDIVPGYTSTVTAPTVAPGNTALITFANWTPNGLGSFDKSCTTRLTSDMLTSNDKLSGKVFVRKLDVQTVQINGPSGTVNQGTSYPVQAVVRNNGNTTVTFPVRFDISDAPPWSNTQTVTSLVSGDQRTIDFAAWTPAGSGNMTTKCSTQLVNDLKGDNNKVTVTNGVFVRVLNGTTVSLDSPAGNVVENSTVTPKATIRNDGNTTEDILARYTIPGFDAYVSTRTANLGPGASTQLSFNPWTASVPLATYYPKCSTEVTGDRNTSFDKQSGSFTVVRVDALTQSIDAPVGTIARGTTVTPKATVKNNGTNPATFTVKFDIDDNPPYTSTKPVTGLGPGSTIQVSFDNWFSPNPGYFNTKCSTQLASDGNLGNDKLTGTVEVQGFDVQPTLIIQPTGNINQGVSMQPRATFRNNGTTTASFGILFRISDGYVSSGLDSVRNLGAGSQITVTFPLSWTASTLGPWNTKCSTFMTGDQNPGNDTALGSIFVQRLEVQTSAILAPTGTVNQDTVIAPQATVTNNGNNQQIFDVKFDISDGYTSTRPCTVPAAASRTVTFAPWTATTLGNLTSKCSTRLAGDVNNTNDRWLGTVFVQFLDARCVQINAPAGNVNRDTAIIPQALIRNNGNTAQTISVRFDISPGYTDTKPITLGPGAEGPLDFASWTASPIGEYATKCTTLLAGDQATANDKQEGTVFVQYLDAATVEILGPTGIVNQDTVLTPQATVKNNSNNQQTFNVKFYITPGYEDTKPVTLAAGAQQTVDFANWTASTLGSFTTKCSTALAGDRAPGNNQLIGTVFVRRLEVQTVAIIAPPETVAQGATIVPQATVRNNGNTIAPAFQVRFTIGSYSNTQTVTGLGIGATTPVLFDDWNASTLGSLAVKCTTMMAGDKDRANDAVSGTVFVQLLDAEAVSITAPTGDVDSGDVVAPQVSVRNNGNTTVSFDVNFTIEGGKDGADDAGGTDGYSDTKPVTNLGSGASRTVTFADWNALVRGSHPTKCTTRLTNDAATGNDFKTGTVFVNVKDAEVLAILAPSGSVDSGTTVFPQATIRNNGNTEQTFDVRFDISTAYSNTQTVTLAAGASQPVSFASWEAVERGLSLATKCTTLLDGDRINGNDFKTGSFTVNVHDVASRMIVQPLGGIIPGSIVPQALVCNYGSLREPVTVTFRIPEAFYTQTRSLPIGLPLGVDTLIEFPSWTATPGAYTTRCSTYLANDQIPVNNVIMSSVWVGNVDVGVLRIVSPIGSVDSGATIEPQAWVMNFSDIAAGFRAHFRINDGSVYLDSSGFLVLDAGDSAPVSFPAWPKPHPLASYTTTCSTYAYGDGNHANDAQHGQFTVVALSHDSGWTRKADVPTGGKNKRVKDGGAMAYREGTTDADSGYIYAFKGNNTVEFYAYNTTSNAWATKESIPKVGRSGKKKAVKKGAALANTEDKFFATKGNNTIEFWKYDPTDTAGHTYVWKQKADVPAGAKNVKEGAGMVPIRLNDSLLVYFLKGSGTQEFYRYNPISNVWLTRASAPAGLSGKPFKNGSCIAYDGDNTIYAVKGSYNEFFSYSVDSNRWTTKTALPLIGSSGRKKKVKDGAGAAYHNGIVYALKGGNTQEFWTYMVDSDKWFQKQDLPLGGGKRVKGGGALVYASAPNALFAFKGNNTFECWKYILGSAPILAVEPGHDVMGGSAPVTRGFSLVIAPNPFTGRSVIRYSLPRAGRLSLKLYDVTGALVTTLRSGFAGAGDHTIGLDARNLARGIYVLKLEAEAGNTTRKLIIE
jgi:hypothetical protein